MSNFNQIIKFILALDCLEAKGKADSKDAVVIQNWIAVVYEELSPDEKKIADIVTVQMERSRKAFVEGAKNEN